MLGPELPAIQAAMRALVISAMKGSRLSQKALAEITQTAEAREERERMPAIENAIDSKQKWTAEIERCRRLGSEEPSPLPHADDIIIDMRTGHVRTHGPVDELEKASAAGSACPPRPIRPRSRAPGPLVLRTARASGRFRDHAESA